MKDFTHSKKIHNTCVKPTTSSPINKMLIFSHICFTSLFKIDITETSFKLSLPTGNHYPEAGVILLVCYTFSSAFLEIMFGSCFRKDSICYTNNFVLVPIWCLF